MRKHGLDQELSAEDLLLLRLVKRSMCWSPEAGGCFGESTDAENIKKDEAWFSKDEFSGVSWEKVLSKAKKHSVISLLYEPLSRSKDVPKDVLLTVTEAARTMVRQSYRLLFLTKYVVKLLEKADIRVLVLKGAAAAAMYPVPELRKSGDVDLIIADDSEFAKACSIMASSGFELSEEQKTNHHISFSWKGNIEVELHHQLAEPFDSEKTNKYLVQVKEEYISGIKKDCLLGICLPMPGAGHHAFYLLIHMLQHFLRAGFGLKLLVDWVVFWNGPVAKEEQVVLANFLKESGLFGFASMITAVCVQYLGLCKENTGSMEFLEFSEEAVEEFMIEVLEAEEFGKSQKNRMVVMRGTRFRDYVREFHHQMRLNYPVAGKYVVLWPFLWLSALVVFIYNNRKKRGVSSIDILKKAGKRSRMMEEMSLFKQK